MIFDDLSQRQMRLRLPQPITQINRLEPAGIAHRAVITRLGVRLERAGFFRFQAFHDPIGHRLENGELLLTVMCQLRTADHGSRIWRRGLQFVQAMIYLLNARKNRRKVATLLFRLQQACYSLRKFLRVTHIRERFWK